MPCGGEADQVSSSGHVTERIREEKKEISISLAVRPRHEDVLERVR